MNKKIPTDIGEYITYDPKTGILTRFKAPSNRGPKNLGPITDKSKTGYIRLRFRMYRFNAHRVAWFLMTGAQPEVIDHIDGDRSNNIFSNLRSGSHRDNMRNHARHRAGRTPGISYHKQHKKWMVYTLGKKKHLGYFQTELEALDFLNKETPNE